MELARKLSERIGCTDADSSGRDSRDERAVYEGPQAPEAFHRRFQEADSRPLKRRQAQARDQEEDEGRRDFPGQQLGPHAGDSEAEVHSGARVGQEEVLGHVEAGGDGRAEGKGGGLEEDGAGDG